MVILPGTAVTIGATLLDFCLLFYAHKKIQNAIWFTQVCSKAAYLDYIYNHKKYFHNINGTYFKTIYLCKYYSLF